MSTPGRKRVQPILIDDDDDTESTSTNTESAAPSLPLPIPDTSPSLLTSRPLAKKHIYVELNFDELSHIRNVQTNGEFATLLYDFKLYKNVVNGQICFSCRKVKFSLIQPGTRCAICLQRVCHRCQRKMNYRPDHMCFVSLNLLRRSSATTFTNELAMGRNERTNSESSSSSSSTTLTTTNKLKKLPRTRPSTSSFSCCIDCFILFDPASLVWRIKSNASFFSPCLLNVSGLLCIDVVGRSRLFAGIDHKMKVFPRKYLPPDRLSRHGYSHKYVIRVRLKDNRCLVIKLVNTSTMAADTIQYFHFLCWSDSDADSWRTHRWGKKWFHLHFAWTCCIGIM